jgi:AcrR family transcriptional regulator
MKGKRTQAQRTAATRTALIDAGRELFGARGYADVSTPEIAAAAGVSRGALYHQFDDKLALFAAVVEAVEAEVTQRLAALVAGAQDPLAALRAGAAAWLDIAGEAEVRRLVLTEGPVVLGWEAWRDLVTRHGLGLVEQVLALGIESGTIAPLPVPALAAIVAGALDEAALYVAGADDPAAARADALAVLERLLDGIVA